MSHTRRILITGGAGFLGQALAAVARAAGHVVIIVDQVGAADRQCDIGDSAAVAGIMAEVAPDAVVHLAAMLTDAAAADPVAATRINALGTAVVFAGAMQAGAKRVVYTSSIAAVGPCPEGSGDEVPLAPRTAYGATKAFGEHLARALAATPGAPSFVVLRLGWVYGPGRDRGWRLPQELILRFAGGDHVVRWPDLPEPIDWTWVSDAAEVLLRAVLCPLPAFAVFNVAGDKRPMRDAVAHLRRRFPGVQAVAEPAATPPSAWGLANDGLESALGYAPSTRLEQGIDAMLDALARETRV